MNQPKLSIIIPMFNEEKRILKKFDQAFKFISQNIKSYEIILVNDGSLDQTEKVSKKICQKYPHTKLLTYFPNHGKGYAVKLGIQNASGLYICFMDADFAIDLKYISIFLSEIEKPSIDIVIADRNKPQSHLKGQVNYLRRSLSLILAGINNSLLNLHGIKDTQCGFKFFKSSVAKDLFLNLTIYRWLFDIEILSNAIKKNYRIKSLPVSWEQVDQSKVTITRDLYPIMKDLIKIYFKNFSKIKSFPNPTGKS